MYKRENLKRFLLLVSLFWMVAGCSTNRKPADYPFDIYMDMTTEEDVNTLKNASFVEGVFPFSLMTFQRPDYEGPMNGQIALLITRSFDNLRYSPYAEILQEDEGILQDPLQNPILISSSLAKAEKLSIGDILYQETKVSDQPLFFTVAGVFEQAPLFAQFEAVALCNDQIKQFFSERVDELGYTNVYIKSSDLSALKNYLDEEFIPHLQWLGMPEEEIQALPREEVFVGYEEHQEHMDRMK